MGRQNFMLGVLTMVGLASVTRPSRADVCYELVNAIPHPAEYGPACYLDLDDLNFTDLLCIAVPQCCVPVLCQTIPACWTTTLIRNSYQQEFTCNITIEDALFQWTNGYLYLNNNAISPFVNALYAEGEPLTPQMFQLMHDLGESHLTQRIDWPTDFQLSAIRIVNESESLNPLALGVEKGRTFGNVFVVSDGRYQDLFQENIPSVRNFECGKAAIDPSWFDSFKTMLHEIAHTTQYRNLGTNGFYSVYVPEVVFNGGEDVSQIGLEEAAERFESDFEAACIRANGSCDVPDAPPSPAGEALSASKWVRINDRAQIWTKGGISGSCGSVGRLFPCYGRANAAGVGGMYLGVNSRTGRLRSGGPVDLRDRSLVEDSIEAAGTVTVGNQVVVHGEISEAISAPPDPFAGFSISYPAFGPSVSLEPGQTIVLDPSSYGDLRTKPGSIVYLSGGTYYFRSVDLDVDSLMAIQNTLAPTRLFVFGGLQFKGILEGEPSETLVMVTNGGVELTGRLAGTLLVPNGKVNIHGLAPVGSPSHEGAVIADSIELHQDRIFVHVPFVHSWEPPAFIPPPPGALMASVQLTSSWATGYCATLSITNSGGTSSSWGIVLSTNGSTITSTWNAQFGGTAGIVEIYPAQAWNATIPPQTTTSTVGFCASKPTPGAVASVVSVGPL
jgi:hypothetical protein